MSEFDLLMVDELRREFRRTRPPAKAIMSHYTAGIFRLTEPYKIGFRVYWYPSDLPHPISFMNGETHIELIQPLES